MASDLTNALGDLLKKAITKKLIGAVAKRIPLLAAGPFGWVANFFISMFVGKALGVLLEKTEMGVRFLWVDIQVNGQSSNYVQAYAQVRMAATEKERLDAEAALDAAFNKFVEY